MAEPTPQPIDKNTYPPRRRSIPGAVWHYLTDPKELLAARVLLAAGPVFLVDTLLAPVTALFPPLAVFLLANEWVWFVFLIFYFMRKINEHRYL